MAEEMADEVAFRKVDADANPQLRAKYAPQGLQTYVFFYDGKVVGSHPGAFRDLTRFKSWLRDCQERGENPEEYE